MRITFPRAEYRAKLPDPIEFHAVEKKRQQPDRQDDDKGRAKSRGH